MSLINQLLKDLEKRRAENKPDQEVPPPGLSSSDDMPQSTPHLKRNIILLVLLILALSVIIYFQFFYTGKAPTAVNAPKASVNITRTTATPSATTTKTTPTEASETASVTVTPAIQEQEGGIIAKEASIDSIKISHEDKNTTVSIQLSDKAHYQLSTDLPNHLIKLILDNTDQNGQPFVLPKTSAIDKITTESTHNDLTVTFALKDKTTVDSAGFDATKTNMLVLSLHNAKIAPPPSKEEISIQAANTPEGQAKAAAKNTYDKAVNLLSTDNIDKSVQQLTTLVAGHPDYLKARLALIKLLIKQNHLARARQYINTGLAQTPDNSALVVLQARLYFLRGHNAAALTTLQNIPPPPIQDNPEYYAFTAALQQRLGHVAIAAQLYQQLLELDANNAKWWLGLAIAYETAEKNNAALAAYQRALAAGNLNPNLQAYVASKVSELGG
jgi:MSHA biogenesis protein MshN